MQVSFVVPTHRRLATLRATLAALGEVTPPPGGAEIVVVDDGREEQVRAHVGTLPGVTYVAGDGRGAAAARNAGARAAQGELLLFCDDDMLVAPDHALRHLALHERFGRCATNGTWDFSEQALAALRATPFGRFRIDLERGFIADAMRGAELGEGCVEAATVSAADLGIARREFLELDGFDESFPSAGAEDQDLSLRARRAGLRLVRSRDIRPRHEDSHTSLDGFCDRERRGAVTFAVLARRHPAEYAATPYVVENGPARAQDGRARRARKAVKGLAASPAGLRASRATVEALERVHAPDRVLRRAYSSLIGLYMFRGFQDATLPSDPWARR